MTDPCDREDDIHDSVGFKLPEYPNRIYTNFQPWSIVYSSTKIQLGDLMLCKMKCDGFRAGIAEDITYWELVQWCVVVEKACDV